MLPFVRSRMPVGVVAEGSYVLELKKGLTVIGKTVRIGVI